MRVTQVDVTKASGREQGMGLLAYLVVTLDDQLILDGVTLRRTSDGRSTLSFPERRGRHGRKHPTVRPVDAESRASFQLQVLDIIRQQGVFFP